MECPQTSREYREIFGRNIHGNLCAWRKPMYSHSGNIDVVGWHGMLHNILQCGAPPSYKMVCLEPYRPY